MPLPFITNSYSCTYDTAGNILTESKNGTVTKTYTYGNAQWRDLLTAYDGGKIAYEGQTYTETTNKLGQVTVTVTGTPTGGGRLAPPCAIGAITTTPKPASITCNPDIMILLPIGLLMQIALPPPDRASLAPICLCTA